MYSDHLNVQNHEHKKTKSWTRGNVLVNKLHFEHSTTSHALRAKRHLIVRVVERDHASKRVIPILHALA